MIKINNQDVPSRWEDLSPAQYVSIVAAMRAFESGHTDFTGFRMMIVEAIIGKLPQNPLNEILCENVFRMCEVFTFPYKYEYPDPRYDGLSPQTKALIRKRLPSSLDDSDPEIRIVRNFKVGVCPDLCFSCQLLPELPSVPGSKGYEFSVKGALASTTLSAGRYIAANVLLDSISSNQEYFDEALNSLVSVLYGLPDTREIPIDEKMAVMYNFLAISHYISKLDKYDLLFNTIPSGKKSPLGSEASLYTLVEKGYGDIDTIGNMNLFTYLDVLLKQTIECIHSLKACKMKSAEIAQELGLSITQVESIS